MSSLKNDLPFTEVKPLSTPKRDMCSPSYPFEPLLWPITTVDTSINISTFSSQFLSVSSPHSLVRMSVLLPCFGAVLSLIIPHELKIKVP